jgi:hypothetical protein
MFSWKVAKDVYLIFFTRHTKIKKPSELVNDIVYKKFILINHDKPHHPTHGERIVPTSLPGNTKSPLGSLLET